MTLFRRVREVLLLCLLVVVGAVYLACVAAAGLWAVGKVAFRDR